MIEIITLIVSIIAILFAGYLAYFVLKQDKGTPAMQEISNAIKEGSIAFLKRQYGVVGIYFAIVFVILLVLVKLGYLVMFVPFAFLTGGFFSALAGFIGMIIATSANARTTAGAKKSLNSGLKIAFSSGAFMGLTVVALGLLDLSIWFIILNWYYQPGFCAI